LRLVDLSIPLRDGMKADAFPSPGFLSEVTHAWSRPRYVSPCKGMAKRAFMMDEHTGTHVDAPFHFDPDGPTLDRVPVDKFGGAAKFLDLTDRRDDQPVTKSMLEEASSAQGVMVKEGDILILRTVKAKWNSPAYYRYSGIAKSGAEALVSMGVRAVGLDLWTADTISDLSKPAHTILCEEQIPIFECLVGLEKLRPGPLEFFGFPLNMKGATGSPVRAVARY
jgi:arylformamidase